MNVFRFCSLCPLRSSKPPQIPVQPIRAVQPPRFLPSGLSATYARRLTFVILLSTHSQMVKLMSDAALTIASPNHQVITPGMGANLDGSKCRFRVWAPNALQVSVVGSFNDWNTQTDFLTHEGSGYWAGVVEGAQYRDECELTNSNGNSVIIDPSFDWGDAENYSTPPWHEWVIYEMHIGTFNDGPDGDSGTFDRAIEKLDYLANDLGINAIEVMPCAEFPGSSSWGYNPSHLFAIERDYGGPKAFRRFIKAAHERGIAVILDVVYNHFGPSDIDLWQFDGWSDVGQSGGIYMYDDSRAETPWGHTRPNYGRGEVRQFLRDNALYWLEEFQLDGLRFDATGYIQSVDGFSDDLPEGWGLMQWINREVNQKQPWKLLIAEDLRENAWVTRSEEEGGAGFDTQWSSKFTRTIREAVITQYDKDRNMIDVAAAISQCFNGDPLQRVIYTESHDEVANGNARVPEEIWPNNADSWFSKKRSTLGAAVTLTSPGIPMLFQGQEFVEDLWFTDTDPLDWGRCERYSGIVQLYRDLVRLRRNWFDNTKGLQGRNVNCHHINDAEKVLAMHRWDKGGAGDDVIVVFNFSNQTLGDYRIGFPEGGRWTLRLNTDSQQYDPDFGVASSFDTTADGSAQDGFKHSGTVALPPYSAVVYSKD